MNLAQRCKSDFDHTTRIKGEGYFRCGAVQILERAGQRVSADVEGSAYEPYAVTIDWSQAYERQLSVDCSCPRFNDGHLCKHVWATILMIDDTKPGGTVPGQWPLDVVGYEDDYNGYEDIDDEEDCFDDGDTPAVGFLGHAVRRSEPPAQQRHGKSRSARAAAPPDWQLAFDTLRAPVRGGDSPGPWDHFQRRDRVAWYALNLSQSVAEGQLIVDLLQRERNKSGDLGRIKTLSLETQPAKYFDDPLDCSLLAQLLAVAHSTLASQRNYGYGYSYHYRYNSSVSQVSIPAVAYELLLPRLAATGRFAWSLDGLQSWEEAEPITWDAGEPWTFRLVIARDDAQQQWTLTGEFTRGQDARPMSDVAMFLPTGLVLFKNLLLRTVDHSAAWISWVYQHSPITVPYARRDDFLRTLWGSPALPPILWPENLAVEQVRELPQPRLRVRQPKHTRIQQAEMVAELDFRYGDKYVEPQDPVTGVLPEPADGQGPLERVLLRDHEAERAYLTELGKLPVVQVKSYGRENGTLRIKAKQLPAIVDQLLARGWCVEAEGRPYRSAGTFRLQVQSGINWFDLEASMDFDGIEVPFPDLLAALRRGQKYVELGDGSRGILPEEWLKRYTALADLGETADGKVRFVRSQALLLDALLAEQQNLRVDRAFEEYRERLRSFSGVAPHDPPSGFQGVLRDYQRHGLGWLQFLNEMGLGGCLADDMGLGKTVQVLALLEERRCRRLKRGAAHLPSLVIVPKSLVFNWIDEAQRFTPQLRVLNYTGLQRATLREQLEEAPVVVTTYGTVRQDIVELQKQQFDYVILDEAQAIKNANSQVAKASLLLQADHRLALSGTPIENHLGELWSLFEFLNPGMLGRSTAFATLCKSAKADDQDSLCRLARAVAPFILRRTKEQVLTELPEKTEQTLYCELAPKERKDYDQLRDYFRAKLANVIDQRGLKNSKIHVLEALLRLRQAACHPGLIDPRRAQSPSTKLDTLLEQLGEVIGEGHKALVFSQFTSLLAIVRDRLDKASIRYEYLDGQTHNRKAVVQRFQNDASCPVFLISLKAGGHGLNLTAADYVFILDPWWNPAVEMQAIDRTHRIGQTRRVFAYRIIARDTVEEKVIALQNGKRDLANAIVTANDSLIRRLTVEDLQLILS